MCTLAWGTETGCGLWVCFNRDEQRTRARAEAPRLHPGPEGPLGYARDPDGGGTWLAVAARGFVVAVLNQYGVGVSLPKGAGRSRGLLVRDLAGAASAAGAEKALRSELLEAYAPFHLFILSPERSLKADWDGTRLVPDVARGGWFTTSSHRPEAIAAARKEAWERFRTNHPGAALEAVARRLRETAANPAEGMTMDREDARTVSQAGLRLGREGFTITYRARAVGGTGFEAPVILTCATEEPGHGRAG